MRIGKSRASEVLHGMRGEAGMIIAEVPLEFDGKLQILHDPNFKVKSKIPWCDLSTQLDLTIRDGKAEINNVKTTVNYILSNISLSFYLNDILISVSAPAVGPFFSSQTGTLILDNIFSTFNLTHIESLRNGDISFRLLIAGSYGFTLANADYSGMSTLFHNVFAVSIIKKFSEREWLKLLSEMGYGEKMVIAIDNPKLEGYHEVMELIEKANTGISHNGNPDDIIKNLRAAWKRMNVYLEKYNDELRTEINGQSKTDDKDPKPEKIERLTKDTITLLETLKSLEDNIYNLTHIGAHPETYTSNREDALLAFRLTVSLMSYYSGILKRVSEDEVT